MSRRLSSQVALASPAYGVPTGSGVRSSRILSLLAAVALAATTHLIAPATRAGRIAAQEAGSVSGSVTAAGTQEPLVGAQVTIAGGAQRAVTDERGRFRLTGLAGAVGSPVTLLVRRIGYREVQLA